MHFPNVYARDKHYKNIEQIFEDFQLILLLQVGIFQSLTNVLFFLKNFVQVLDPS